MIEFEKLKVRAREEDKTWGEPGDWVEGYFVHLYEPGTDRDSYRIYTGVAEAEPEKDGYTFYGDWKEIDPCTIELIEGERCSTYEINRQEIIKKLVILENSYNGDLITPATYIAELQSIIYNNAFGKLEDGIETAVKNAKIFINDIQDGGDYAFACGIVSALKFVVDEETHTELEELLEKQTKWEQTRNDNKEK